MSIMNRKSQIICSLFAICLVSLILGCGKLKGEFAFRTFDREAYTRIEGTPEFEQSEFISWVFIFEEITERHDIGVIIMKKELVWVDVNTRLERITPMRNIIYGEIKDYEEGTYKMIITKDGSVINQKEFVIFKDDEKR